MRVGSTSTGELGTDLDKFGRESSAPAFSQRIGSGKVGTITNYLAHELSNPAGVGRQLGSQPRANVSMTIMRAPQCGHGQGSTRGASAGLSCGFCGSPAGWATPRRARAVAMLSARLMPAKS